MATLAVARHHNASLADQVINVGLIKRLPERIAVRRLIPLGMSAFMTLCTALGGYEGGLTDELASCRICVGRCKRRGTIRHLVTCGRNEVCFAVSRLRTKHPHCRSDADDYRDEDEPDLMRYRHKFTDIVEGARPAVVPVMCGAPNSNCVRL
jgi:hypothetical protein